MAALLPTEGARTIGPRVADVLDRDVKTCPPGTRVADARASLSEATHSIVVTSPDGVVLGVVTEKQLRAADNDPVERHMRFGPATIRPSEILADVAERMRNAEVASILVTNPDGVLLGALALQDADRLIHERHQEHAG